MKKAGMVVISLVVTAALVGGVGYGAYYTMQGKKEPVEVVPVINVNSGYWGDDETVYGTVTSQVAQTITLNEEYQIDKIYVSAGDTVKEGTPLFSYDMTLPELELEMAELDLQAKELEKVKLEKDLDKLKKTKTSASLEHDSMVKTASADEVILDDGNDAPVPAGNDPAENQTEPAAADVTSGGSISVDGVEAVDSVPEAAKTENQSGEESGNGTVNTQDSTVIDAVSSYETLVSMIDVLFQVHGDSLTAEEIGGAVKDCVAYYRKNLADKKTVSDGTEKISYVLKDSVKEALGEDGTKELEESAKLMEKYQIRYVELLIRELDPENPGDFSQAVQEAREQYEDLTADAKTEVSNFDRLTEMETKTASQETLPENQTEDPNGNSDPVETELQTEMETESEAGTETETGTEVQTETETETETEVQTENETGTEIQTETETETETGAQTETETETETGAQTETETETETGAQTETETETETGAQTETETETETGAQTETETETETGVQTETETETESETEAPLLYPVTITNGRINEEEAETVELPASVTVTITAVPEDGQQTFMGWKVTPADVELADPTAETTTSVMPEHAVEIEALFSEKIDSRISAFLSLAETALGADGVTLDHYDAAALETALIYYQANLAVATDDIVDGTVTTMEEYQLAQVVQNYLKEAGKEEQIAYLRGRYKQLCQMFVKTLVDDLETVLKNDGISLVSKREAFEKAKKAYENLGDTWRDELDQSVYSDTGNETEPSDGSWSHNGETTPIQDSMDSTESQTGDVSESETEAPTVTVLTYGERLAVYEVVLMIQELDPTIQEDLLIEKLKEVRDAYLALSDGQKAAVWNSDTLISLLKQYGLWSEEPQTEPGEPDFPDDVGGGFDVGGDLDYTAEELNDLFDDNEREIKTCDLDIREKELKLEQSKRIVDGKVVKSTMDGMVISIGSADGTSDTDGYFAKVANTSGLYLKGTIDELSVSNLHEGDTVTGNSANGMSFTAVIKEVSQYPDPNGAENLMYYSGSQNTNVTYYPFYALIEDSEGIEEGQATFQFTGSGEDSSSDIYLPKYLVREESDGRSYVYKDDNGKLKKQYVGTGKTVYDYAIQISSGLSMDDKIAFPYGDDVTEGAQTKEVDNLTALSE